MINFAFDRLCASIKVQVLGLVLFIETYYAL